MRKLLWFVAVLALATVALWALSKTDWLAQFNDQRDLASQESIQTGQAFGREHDQAACLVESMQRFDGCTGFECTVWHGRFLRGCLETAEVTPEFCADVPEFREKPTEEDKSWAKFYCLDRNIRGEGCRLLMRQQQKFCSEQGG